MDKQAVLPLKDVRVLDITQVRAGPFATRQFADMGAEVIKIESWQRPDWNRFATRTAPPHKAHLKPPLDSNGTHNALSRNKYGITLDFTRPAGKELFLRLVKVADVIVENFSAKVMVKLGLGYPVLKEVNPGIIMASMPGFGLYGPDCDRPAYGTTVEAISGLMELNGYPDRAPARNAFNYADPCGGINAVVAVLMALNYRTRTGKGQQIDMAQAEGVSCMIGEAFMEYTMNGRVQQRMGNRDRWLVQGVYPCGPTGRPPCGPGEDNWVGISLTGD